MRTWISIVCLIFFGGLYWFFSVSQKHLHESDNDETQIEGSVNDAAVSIQHLTLHEYSKNRDYELVLTAKLSVFNHRAETVTCQGVACTVLKNAVDIGAWYAQQSTVDRINKTITCTGSVHGRFQDVTFQGNNMVYNFADQTVHILGGVKTEFSNGSAANYGG